MDEHEVKPSIREATASDREGLAALLTGLADERLDDIGIVIDPTPFLPEHAGAMLQFMRSQGCSLLVAECDGLLAGFLLLTRPEECAGTHCAGVTMAVAREYRRRRVGSALLATAQQMVETQGMGGLQLTVRKHNEPAIRLYERFAFEKTDETETDFKMRWQNRAAAH
jgi:ribosomal protein S18 acetylase RimI-like enzyme